MKGRKKREVIKKKLGCFSGCDFIYRFVFPLQHESLYNLEKIARVGEYILQGTCTRLSGIIYRSKREQREVSIKSEYAS